MNVLSVGAISIIEYEQYGKPGLKKTAEVLKTICREDGEAAEKIWEGLRQGKTLAEAKKAVMDYVRDNDGICTEEDAKRILREMYGIPRR